MSPENRIIPAQTNESRPTLYGVIHYVRIENCLLGTAENGIVLPSPELIKELESLPKGSMVGLEYHPQQDKLPDPYALPKAVTAYWRSLIRTIESLNLCPVFLEDMPTYLKYFEKAKKTEDLKAESRMLMWAKEGQAEYQEYIALRRLAGEDAEEGPEEQGPGKEQKLKDLDRQIYQSTVEAQYLFEIEREEAILRNIAKTPLAAVVVGQSHGDYFSLNSEILAANGIVFNSYFQEAVAVDPLSRKGRYQARLERDSSPNKSLLIERESLIRRYHAVTLGRVLPHKTPAFIGTWDLDNPARGLFEIYPESPVGKEIFYCIIEDSLGTASAKGRITDKGLCLTKEYKPDKSSGEAIRLPIYYGGYLFQNLYEGMYWTYSQGLGIPINKPFQLRLYTAWVANNLAKPLEERKPLFDQPKPLFELFPINANNL